MRLVKVTGTTFLVTCKGCHQLVRAGDGHNIVADLDGDAWHAYYHASAGCIPEPNRSEWYAGYTNIVDAKVAALKEVK